MKSYLDHALAMSPLLHFPEELERIKIPSGWLHDHNHEENKGMEPAAVDIKETPKEYVFYADVPGLTKSDIQVYVEEEKLLVIKCQGGKRKREAVEDEEGCKYLRMERKRSPKFARKFTLPGDANVEGISASCVDGVLTVTVPRIPPAMKFKTIQVSVN